MDQAIAVPAAGYVVHSQDCACLAQTFDDQRFGLWDAGAHLTVRVCQVDASDAKCGDASVTLHDRLEWARPLKLVCQLLVLGMRESNVL